MLDIVAHLRDGDTSFIKIPRGKEKIVIDIGMHDTPLTPFPGQMTIGFEPIPSVFNRQQAALRKSHPMGSVALNAAVSESDGSTVFSETVSQVSSSILSTNPTAVKDRIAAIRNDPSMNEMFGKEADTLFKAKKTFPVTIVRLEPLLKALPRGVYVDFFKIDAQGADLKVAKGCGSQLAARVRPDTRHVCISAQRATEALFTHVPRY